MPIPAHQKRMYRIRQRWPVVPTVRDIVPAAVLLVLLLIVLHFFDRSIAEGLRNLPPWCVDAMTWLTRWGESDWILVPAALVAALCAMLVRILPQRPLRRAVAEISWFATFVLLGVGLPSLAATLLKRLFGRARPGLLNSVGDLAFRPNWSEVAYQSFPSGHTATAFALAMVAGYLAPRFFWAVLLFALAIAWSRMAVGMHYLTDVAFGAAVGTFGAYLVRNWFADRGWLFHWRIHGEAVARSAAIRRAFRRRGAAAQPTADR